MNQHIRIFVRILCLVALATAAIVNWPEPLLRLISAASPSPTPVTVVVPPTGANANGTVQPSTLSAQFLEAHRREAEELLRARAPEPVATDNSQVSESQTVAGRVGTNQSSPTLHAFDESPRLEPPNVQLRPAVARTSGGTRQPLIPEAEAAGIWVELRDRFDNPASRIWLQPWEEHVIADRRTLMRIFFIASGTPASVGGGTLLMTSGTRSQHLIPMPEAGVVTPVSDFLAGSNRLVLRYVPQSGALEATQ